MREPDDQDRRDAEEEAAPLECRRCGSTAVRWRQQGGRWVLFSLHPGVVHVCEKPSAEKDFK